MRKPDSKIKLVDIESNSSPYSPMRGSIEGGEGSPPTSQPPSPLHGGSVSISPSPSGASLSTEAPPLAPDSPTDDKFRSVSHARSSLSRMKHFYDSGELCDVILVVGPEGKEYPAHRLVLGASSDYFAGMFNAPLQESKLGRVLLEHIEPSCMATLIHYCYTGELEVCRMMECYSFIYLE